MKKLISIALLACSLILIQGCGSTPVATANNAEAVVITSVNAGMSLWHDYVVQGKATQAQVDQVKTAYTTYYNAQLIVKAALEQATTSTNAFDITNQTQAVTSAETALLSILNQYLK